MKKGASLPFDMYMAGSEVLQELVHKATNNGIKIHMIGHSAGAILLAHLLKRLKQEEPQLKVMSCSLMAPACTLEDFKNYYGPILKTGSNCFGIEAMDIYNLSKGLELDDSVAGLYRKSILHLVSKSFENKRPEAILGMQIHNELNDELKNPGLTFHYSTKKNGNANTQSTTHGGFDNDPATMNSILTRILGKKPEAPFTKKSLKY